MEFGIGIPTSGESWKVAERAEELGFTHAWFYDTQMLVGDPFVAMGAAALKTSRIRLGTGVLVPTNRIPAVAASAFATLNAMAPGRIDLGVGTGFSARRAMGLGAMKLAAMEEYIRVVYALLNGEMTEAEVEPGVRKKLKFLNPELGLINIKDPIRLHISALGPKGREMTARHGAAWKTVMSGVDDGLAALDGMRKTWEASGRAAADLYSSAWIWGCLLRDGETLDSPRVRAQAGTRPGGNARGSAVASRRRSRHGGLEEHISGAGQREGCVAELCGGGAQIRAGGCALPAEPHRALRRGEARGGAVHHRRADPADDVHRGGAGHQAANGSDARRRNLANGHRDCSGP
jgi:alkanesulfonate monooxygenase SsuD/methylene tetrahydromethanopterin reductase-like flavin-dependent oxidoreductase (luciferase family)